MKWYKLYVGCLGTFTDNKYTEYERYNNKGQKGPFVYYYGPQVGG